MTAIEASAHIARADVDAIRAARDRRRQARRGQYLAEILTHDGRLLRRIRAATIDSAASWAKFQAARLPELRRRAERIEVYKTQDEPNAAAILTLKLYRPPNG